MSDCTAKILIIDDEVNICHVLGTRLTLLGYKTVFASDGKEALTKFSEEKPDLIILDIMLPRIDGYEVCRKILFGEKSQSRFWARTALKAYGKTCARAACIT